MRATRREPHRCTKPSPVETPNSCKNSSRAAQISTLVLPEGTVGRPQQSGRQVHSPHFSRLRRLEM